MELFLMCFSILIGAFLGLILVHWRGYELNVGSVMTAGAIGSWGVTGGANMMLGYFAHEGLVSVPLTIVCSVLGAVLASGLFVLIADHLIRDDGGM